MDKKVRERAKKRRQRNAPFQWAAGAMAFYIVVILTVNAALEMETARSGFTVKVFANGLLSLLSVIAGLIIALRSQHRRRLEQFSRRKSAQVQTPKSAEVAQTPQITRRRITESEFLRLVGAQSYAEVANIAEAHGLNGNYGDWLASKRSVAQLAKLVEVSPRTAQYWVGKTQMKGEANHD
jgi:cation transport ATPase